MTKGTRTSEPMKKRVKLKVKGPRKSLETSWATNEQPQIRAVSSRRRVAVFLFMNVEYTTVGGKNHPYS